MGGPIESVHSVSVEEETGRLVVGLQPDYGGLGGLHLAAEEGSETGGTIVVLNSIYCLADPLTHFLQGTLSWKEEQVSDYYTPLTLESELRYGSIPWIEEQDEETMEAMRSSAESLFPGGDVTQVYFYTGRPGKPGTGTMCEITWKTNAPSSGPPRTGWCTTRNAHDKKPLGSSLGASCV